MRTCSFSNAYLPHTHGIEVLLKATSAPLHVHRHEILVVTGDGNSPPSIEHSVDEWLPRHPGSRSLHTNAWATIMHVEAFTVANLIAEH